jgi:hypothetical protein
MARKKSPPKPKSTKNMPAGLKKYWASKGVGSAKKSKSKK